ncbi:NAD(P)-binding protein [Peniophora sp. CONT]|nr:NAD(P)-binding protein [Peniophora sp. CONT]
MAATVPTTQRAWICTGRGTPNKVLRLETNYPVPSQLPKGNVLIKVKAAALNPVGYKLMGMLPLASLRATIPEYELAGTIVDANGTHFAPGDEIVAHITPPLAHKTKQGALAEYVWTDANNCVIRPANITPTQAAGVPLAGQTAWQGLFENGGLQDGQTVFVNGGSTAVGSFAIQWAKARGCRVVASASAKNEQYVRDLGADEFIDYTKEDLVAQLVKNPPATKYHVFYECAGLVNPDLYLKSQPYLAPNGVFVTVGPQPHSFGDFLQLLRLFAGLLTPTWLGGIKSKWSHALTKTSAEDMQTMFGLLAEGKARPLVDSVYSMEDALKAYERLKTMRATGKVVVKIDPSAE